MAFEVRRNPFLTAAEIVNDIGRQGYGAFAQISFWDETPVATENPTD